jgi:hypothetical protein
MRSNSIYFILSANGRDTDQARLFAVACIRLVLRFSRDEFIHRMLMRNTAGVLIFECVTLLQNDLPVRIEREQLAFAKEAQAEIPEIIGRRDGIREYDDDVVSVCVRPCLASTNQILPRLAFHKMEAAVTYDQIELMGKGVVAHIADFGMDGQTSLPG